MPRGFPKPPEPIDLPALLTRMWKRHRAADDSGLELFPDPEAPGAAFLALLFARSRRRALPLAVRREEELDRLRLIRHLRQMLDAEELATHNDAHADGLPAVEVGKVLGISKDGVKKRRKRLRVAVELGRHAVRNPRVLSEHLAQEEAVAARPRDWLARRVGDVYARSSELLAARVHLAGNEDSEWLDDLQRLLAKEDADRDRDHDHTVLAHLRFAVEELHEAAAEHPAPASDTEDPDALGAPQVLAAAIELVEDYLGRSLSQPEP